MIIDHEDLSVEDNAILAKVASIICGEMCGSGSHCNSRDAARALFDSGLLVTRPDKLVPTDTIREKA